MSYFAVECGGKYCDHISIVDSDGNRVFENYFNLTYDEMKNQDDLEEFVVAVMDATADGQDQVIITLIGEDDVFIWSVIAGVIDDEIRYNLVDWQKDGKKYRYEPLDKYDKM